MVVAEDSTTNDDSSNTKSNSSTKYLLPIFAFTGILLTIGLCAGMLIYQRNRMRYHYTPSESHSNSTSSYPFSSSITSTKGSYSVNHIGFHNPISAVSPTTPSMPGPAMIKPNKTGSIL